MHQQLSSQLLRAEVGKQSFGLYVHVPFCASRCGYCDFNTYTAGELGSSASPQSWLDGVRVELEMAAAALDGAPPVHTVFIGGGTPSLLGGEGLGSVLEAVRGSFELASDAEITTESNPESTSRHFFDTIVECGFTRVSLGMQSAAKHVLAVLERTHTPGRAVEAAQEARAAGFKHVNLDLIYGSPGEQDEDLLLSLEAVLSAGVDHVSAYALIVEDGTALARKVRHGELSVTDDDVLAARYELIDSVLEAHGLPWYEVSNWAQSAQAQCRHNLGYWAGGNWWGLGPGAHSHIDGTRWWNTKHPARYGAELEVGRLPVAGLEVLSDENKHMEAVMLGVRLRSGLALSELSATEKIKAEQICSDGLAVFVDNNFVLTNQGRLLADAVVRSLLS
ncbi:MAG: radical SAM family heme chaperone HemW [Mycobacteriaceae bacterium]